MRRGGVGAGRKTASKIVNCIFLSYPTSPPRIMSNQAMRPAFVAKLLARPTPPLQPRSTISLESRLYAQELREEIAKQSCHPLIVSCESSAAPTVSFVDMR